jgi:hypothetical protein
MPKPLLTLQQQKFLKEEYMDILRDASKEVQKLFVSFTWIDGIDEPIILPKNLPNKLTGRLADRYNIWINKLLGRQF